MTTTAPQTLDTDRRVRRYDDIRDLLPDIDNPTPLVRVRHVMPDAGLSLFLKLEWLNPFGSIKDRAAAAILEGADQLEANPKMGKMGEGELREWFVPFGVAAYVLRYRLDSEGRPVVIRVWHSRESR